MWRLVDRGDSWGFICFFDYIPLVELINLIDIAFFVGVVEVDWLFEVGEDSSIIQEYIQRGIQYANNRE